MHARLRRAPIVLLSLAAACGGAAPTEQTASTTGGAQTQPSATAVESIDADGTGAMPSAAEPGLRHRIVESGTVGGGLEPVSGSPDPEREEVRVRFRQMQLRPGEEYVPPVSPCQDVLIYVREGALEAIGAGIAEAGAPATLYAGDAVRFGPEGDGKVTNASGAPARTIVAYTRAAGSGSARLDGVEVAANVGGRARAACTAASAPRDPRVQPSRMASERTTEPLVIAGGKMRVRILLDESGSGARHGGLAILEGDPDVGVPEHRHEESAEVLFIEDGEGQMRLGDRQVQVRPGSVIYVPPNVLHDFRGAGTRPLRAIQVYAPSGPEQRFRALARESQGR